MSRYYDFQCVNCGWVEKRYANSSRCRHCGMTIKRIISPTKDEQITALKMECNRLNKELNFSLYEARRLRGVLLEAKVRATGAAEYGDLIAAKEVCLIISAAKLLGNPTVIDVTKQIS